VRCGWRPGAEADSMPDAEPDADPGTEPHAASGAGAGGGSGGNNVNSGFWNILGLRSPSPAFRRAVHSIRHIAASSHACAAEISARLPCWEAVRQSFGPAVKRTSGSGTQYCNGNTAGWGGRERQKPRRRRPPLHCILPLFCWLTIVVQGNWARTYSIFGIAVDRNLTLKWLFP
jgi:hypothetical protein